MKKLKCFVVSDKTDQVNYVFTPQQFATIADLADFDGKIYSGDDLRSGKLKEAEIIFSTWGMPSLTDKDMEFLPNLKFLFYAAGATDGFARPLLKKNIGLMSAWQMNAIPVAEFCYSQTLLALKGYFRNIRELNEKRDWARDVVPIGPGCYGEQVALLGAGAISQVFQEMLAKHNLDVIVIPSRPQNRTISIDEVFKTAMVVSNHLPDREDNQKCIGKSHFESMRIGATFINTGRGRQIDEEAMYEVFAARPDLTALLDVTYPEPPPANSKLYTLKNILISTHIAGSISDEVHRMSDCAIEEFRNYLKGEKVNYMVSEKMLITS